MLRIDIREHSYCTIKQVWKSWSSDLNLHHIVLLYLNCGLS